MQKKDFKKKEAILDLQKYIDKPIHVTFMGGREVHGILKGFDALQNVVLDEVIDQNERSLGLVVCRGTAIVTIAPYVGYQSIDNPF